MDNKQKFKEIGDLSKEIRSKLFELIELSQDVKMRKSEVDTIIRSLKHLDSYRSKAENFMFLQGIDDIGVFYSSDANE